LDKGQDETQFRGHALTSYGNIAGILSEDKHEEIITGSNGGAAARPLKRRIRWRRELPHEQEHRLCWTLVGKQLFKERPPRKARGSSTCLREVTWNPSSGSRPGSRREGESALA
ncbi:hypothetical protein U1Q18_011959, partial [Sarracenia purpurea var. burkii]